MDISRYGAALQLMPAGRTARLRGRRTDVFVAPATPKIDDDIMFALIDAVAVDGCSHWTRASAILSSSRS